LWQRAGESGKDKALSDFTGAIRTGSKDDQFSFYLLPEIYTACGAEPEKP